MFVTKRQALLNALTDQWQPRSVVAEKSTLEPNEFVNALRSLQTKGRVDTRMERDYAGRSYYYRLAIANTTN